MIRGQRSIYPKKGNPPTGIFSSKGKQKVDSTEKFAHKDALKYARSTNTRSKPGSDSGQSLRHQKHYGRSHK